MYLIISNLSQFQDLVMVFVELSGDWTDKLLLANCDNLKSATQYLTEKAQDTNKKSSKFPFCWKSEKRNASQNTFSLLIARRQSSSVTASRSFFLLWRRWLQSSCKLIKPPLCDLVSIQTSIIWTPVWTSYYISERVQFQVRKRSYIYAISIHKMFLFLICRHGLENHR